MLMEFTPENITELKENEIFVFGSNLMGRHGAGAAYYAMKNFGIKYGTAIGLEGQAYAIPTKGFKWETLPLSEIEIHLNNFITFAETHPEFKFYMTKIGCGLAGIETKTIAELFHKYTFPTNVVLPKEFYKGETICE